MNPIDLAFLLRREFEGVSVVVEQDRVVVLEAMAKDIPAIEALGAEVRG